MNSNAAKLAERIRECEILPGRWQYASIEGFLPEAIFSELVGFLRTLRLDAERRRTTKGLPESLVRLLHDPAILGALSERFGVGEGRASLELISMGEPPRLGAAAGAIWTGWINIHPAEMPANWLLCWRPCAAEFDGLPPPMSRAALLWRMVADRSGTKRPSNLSRRRALADALRDAERGRLALVRPDQIEAADEPSLQTGESDADAD